MSDNVKMFARYALAVGVAFAVGRGWLSTGQGDAVINLVIELFGVVAAFGPAVWAAFKVDNTPKV
jgi:hypothetical protein